MREEDPARFWDLVGRLELTGLPRISMVQQLGYAGNPRRNLETIAANRSKYHTLNSACALLANILKGRETRYGTASGRASATPRPTKVSVDENAPAVKILHQDCWRYEHPCLLGASERDLKGGRFEFTPAAFGVQLSNIVRPSNSNDSSQSHPLSLTLSGIRKVIGQLVEVLRFLHCHGICHSQVLASHIFIDENFDVKLGGLDKCIWLKDAATAYPFDDGCEWSRPPESPHSRDFELYDMWQLGLVVYQMHFGELLRGVVIGKRPEFPEGAGGGAYFEQPELSSFAPSERYEERDAEVLVHLLCDHFQRTYGWELDGLMKRNFGYEPDRNPRLELLAASDRERICNDAGAYVKHVHIEQTDRRYQELRDTLSAAPKASAESLAADVRTIMASFRDPGKLLENACCGNQTPLMAVMTRKSPNLTLFGLLLELGHRKGTLSVRKNEAVFKDVFKRNLKLFADELLNRWFEVQSDDFDFDHDEFFNHLLLLSAENGAAKACSALLALVPPHCMTRIATKAVCAAANASQQTACEELFAFLLENDTIVSHSALRVVATRALMPACQNNLAELVELLLKYRARLDRDIGGTTCIHEAAQCGHLSTLKSIFTHVAKETATSIVSATNASARTALHLAAEMGHAAACKILIDNGADPNTADTGRWTPLHLAARGGKTGVCKLLIAEGAHAAPTLHDGSTPMVLAAATGKIECIRDALLPSGCALASDHEVATRTAYGALLMQLRDCTAKLNKANRVAGHLERTVLFVGWAALYPCGVAVFVMGFSTFQWYQRAWAQWVIGIVIVAVHIGFMLACRQSLTRRVPNHELFDSLVSVGTLLKSASCNIPKNVARDDSPMAVERTQCVLVELELVQRLVLRAQQDPDATRSLVKEIAALDELSKLANANRSAQPTWLEAVACMSKCVIAYVTSATSVADPVRQIAARQAFHAVLTNAEADPDVVSVAGPFRARNLLAVHLFALLRARGELLFLRVISTIVLIVVFVALTEIMFTKEGAVNFHFSNTLAQACINVDELRCEDFLTSNGWLAFDNADCCFGATPDDAWCPGGIRAAANSTSTPNVSALMNATINVMGAGLNERSVYIRPLYANGTSHPTTKVTVKKCTLQEPRPQMAVRSLTLRAADQHADAHEWLVALTVFGSLLFAAQLAVSTRWALRWSNKYQLSSSDTFEASLARHYLLATLHTTIATLCVVIPINCWVGDAPLSESENVGVVLAVLATYPGVAIVTWLPSIGHVAAPILVKGYLGLLFVLGVIVSFRAVPAIESFSIPYFVTDPQRAIVSFNDAASSQTFYVAICVFWFLLLFRMLVAGITTLMPDDSRAHYFKFFRESHVLVAKQLPGRSSARTISAQQHHRTDYSDSTETSDTQQDKALVTTPAPKQTPLDWYRDTKNACPRIAQDADARAQGAHVGDAVVRLCSSDRPDEKVRVWMHDGAGSVTFHLLDILNERNDNTVTRLELSILDSSDTMACYHERAIRCATVRRGRIHETINACDSIALPHVMYFNYSLPADASRDESAAPVLEDIVSSARRILEHSFSAHVFVSFPTKENAALCTATSQEPRDRDVRPCKVVPVMEGDTGASMYRLVLNQVATV